MLCTFWEGLDGQRPACRWPPSSGRECDSPSPGCCCPPQDPAGSPPSSPSSSCWKNVLLIRIRIQRIHIFLGLLDPDPDPLVRGIRDPRILLSLSKNRKGNLDFSCFVTSFWLFIFENDVIVPSKSNMQNFFFKLVFCWCLEGQWWK